MSVQCIVEAVRAVLIAVAVLALTGAAAAQQPKAQPKQPAQQQPAQQQAPQPSHSKSGRLVMSPWPQGGQYRETLKG